MSVDPYWTDLVGCAAPDEPDDLVGCSDAGELVNICTLALQMSITDFLALPNLEQLSLAVQYGMHRDALARALRYLAAHPRTSGQQR